MERQQKVQRRVEAAAAKEAVAATVAQSAPEADILEGADDGNLDYGEDPEDRIPVQTQLQVIPDIAQTVRELFASPEFNLQLTALLQSSRGKNHPQGLPADFHPQAEVLNGALSHWSIRVVPHLLRAIGAVTEAPESGRAGKKRIQIGAAGTNGSEKGAVGSSRAEEGAVNGVARAKEAINGAKTIPIRVIGAVHRAVGNPARTGGTVA